MGPWALWAMALGTRRSSCDEFCLLCVTELIGLSDVLRPARAYRLEVLKRFIVVTKPQRANRPSKGL